MLLDELRSFTFVGTIAEFGIHTNNKEDEFRVCLFSRKLLSAAPLFTKACHSTYLCIFDFEGFTPNTLPDAIPKEFECVKHYTMERFLFFLPLGCDINKILEAAAKVLVQLCIFAVVYKKYIFELYLYHTL